LKTCSTEKEKNRRLFSTGNFIVDGNPPNQKREKSKKEGGGEEEETGWKKVI
jgi:hypothetical protein